MLRASAGTFARRDAAHEHATVDRGPLAVALLRPHELPRFERALAGQLAGIVKPSDDEVLNAVHTALDHLGAWRSGAACWSRRDGGRAGADHLGAAAHLPRSSQKEIFEDELSIAANKWCAAAAAR